MSLLNDIDHCFKTALKNQDRLKLSTLRLLKTALKNREIQERRTLTEAEVVGVITSQVKQRRDSIEEFKHAGRNDLAQQEEEELTIPPLFFAPAIIDGRNRAGIKADYFGNTSRWSRRFRPLNESGHVQNGRPGRWQNDKFASEGIIVRGIVILQRG